MAIISEPNPYESPGSSGRSDIPLPDANGFRHFRVQFFPLWVVTTVATLLVIVPLDFLIPPPLDPRVFPIIIAVQGILLAILVHIITIRISDEGMKCPNSWGKYVYVKWNEISEVRVINLFGFRHVRIFTSTSHRPVWLPLFVTKRQIFWSTVRSFVMPNSPMHEAVLKIEERTKRT